MNYQIAFTQRAELQLDNTKAWWSQNRSAEQATRWYTEISEAIFSLQRNPQRCPLAAEDNLFPYELRELHFGLGSRPTHRAVFTIRPDVVLVLAIRHVAQDMITRDDL